MKFFKKLREKKAATTLVEILIVTPVIAVIMFYGVGIYHMVQQQTYIEDVKFRMIQEMSREGVLTTTDIQGKWKTEFEKMNGVTLVNGTPVAATALGQRMTTTLTFNIRPSIFSNMLGGAYSTTASIYSEAG